MRILDGVNGATTGDAFNWPGGSGVCAVWGTFDGYSVQVQWRQAGETEWFDDADLTFTEKGMMGFTLPQGDIRGVITGSGGEGVDISALVGINPRR